MLAQKWEMIPELILSQRDRGITLKGHVRIFTLRSAIGARDFVSKGLSHYPPSKSREGSHPFCGCGAHPQKRTEQKTRIAL